MTVVARPARFVGARSWHDLSEAAREELKIRVLDALGCALGAMDAPPVRTIRAHLEEFGGRQLCTLIGGGHSAPDRAALYNGSLVRYLDFNESLVRYLDLNDSYFAPRRDLSPERQPRPRARRGRVRARLQAGAAHRARGRLPGAVPALGRGAGAREGFDHTTQRSYAAAAGAAKALPSARPRRRTRSRSRSPARP
jgi:2-methylcitrate dehydratase